jgi:hypothetical protein
LKHSLFVPFAFLVLGLAAGCADAPTDPASPAGLSASREMSRDEAVSYARGDAAMSLRIVDVASVSVTRTGGFWVVDLYRQRGAGVRYAITAADGTIHERRVMQ